MFEREMPIERWNNTFGGLIFIFLIALIMEINKKENKNEYVHPTISGAPPIVNVVWAVIASCPFKVRKIIYSIILLMCTLVFGYLLIDSF